MPWEAAWPSRECCSTECKQVGDMSNITAVAKRFFEACETGKGWEGCRAYCTPNASFAAQAELLAEVRTLQGYADWMKGLLTFIPTDAMS